MTNIEHFLKTHPEPFRATETGVKRFEFRRNDRNFVVGDTLVLQEFTPEQGYSGKEIRRSVDYILHSGFGLPDGYCIMSLGFDGP